MDVVNSNNSSITETFKKHNIDKIIEPYKSARTVYRGLVIPHRLLMWYAVADMVADHIDTYTVAQYKDYPNDQLTDWSTDEIWTQVQKYLNRRDSNARGEEEALRDIMKMIHYLSVIFTKKTGCEELYKDLNENIEDGLNKPHDAPEVSSVDEDVQ